MENTPSLAFNLENVSAQGFSSSHLSLTISPVNNITSLLASTVLPVIYGIERIEIIGPSSAGISVVSTFTVNIYPASKFC